MKGYSEERGQAFKLEYDAASGQFVSKPIDHSFPQKSFSNAVVETLSNLRKRREDAKAKRKLLKTLEGLSPETRDDVGMTDVFAALR
jgi:FixJ family two-component response regulator